MRKHFLVFLIVNLFIANLGFSQLRPIINQQVFQPSLTNPSFYGNSNLMTASLLLKKQWLAINNSPYISQFYFDAPVGDALSVGFNVYYDRQAILTSSRVLGGLAYTIHLGKMHRINFGLSIGAIMNNLDLSEISDAILNDPALINYEGSKTWLDGQFGVSYINNGLSIGLALPNLLASYPTTSSGESSIGLNEYTEVNLFTKYRFKTGTPDFSLEPIINATYVASTPLLLDASFLMHHDRYGWFGLGYRLDYGPMLYLGGNIAQKFMVGYSYDYPLDNKLDYVGGSHEIMLSINFGNKREYGSRGKKLARTKRSNYTATTPSRRQQILEDLNQESTSIEQVETNEIEVAEQLVESENTDPGYDEDAINALIAAEMESDDESVEVEEEVLPDFQPDFTVVEGDHPMELKKGHYVIVGEFIDQPSADEYIALIDNRGFYGQVGYSTDRQAYYVYLFRTPDKNIAYKEIQRVRKISYFTNTWYMVVE